MTRRFLWIGGGVLLIALGILLYRALLTYLPVTIHKAGDVAENVLPVHAGATVGQTVRPPRHLSGIDVRLFGPSGQRLAGPVTLHLRRSPSDTEDVRTVAIDTSTFRRDAHTRFLFPPLEVSDETLYFFLDYPAGTEERPLLVRVERPRPDGEPREDYLDGTAFAGGVPVDGDLAFRLLERGRLPFGVQVVGGVILGGAALLAGGIAGRAQRALPLTVLAVGTPIVFLLPLFKDLTFLGGQDWDMNTTMHTAAFRALVEEQTFPGWNPYLCGGTPLAAFPEAPVFSPFFSTILLGGPVIGAKVSVAIHGIVGFLGMLFWLRRGWRTSWVAAFLGAAMVSFSSFLALHLFAGHTRKIAFAFLPWIVAFLQLAFDDPSPAIRRRLRWTVPGGVALALMLLDGSVYLSVYAALFVAIVGVCTSLLRRSWSPLIASVVVNMLGMLLAGVHIIPVLASQSFLTVQLDPATHVPPLRAIIDVFLDPNQQPHGVKFDGQVMEWFEYGAYVGIAAVLLALLGIVKEWRRLLPWLATGAFFLAGAFAPGFQRLLNIVPVVGDLRNPQRMVGMVVLVVGLAAALGLDRARSWLLGPRERNIPVAGAIATFAVLLIGHLIFVNTNTFATIFTVPPPPSAARAFTQGWAERKLEGTEDSFLFTTANTARNQGSLNRCSVAGIVASTELRLPDSDRDAETPREFRELPYEGEAFLVGGHGSVRVTEQRTSEVIAAYEAGATGAVLALNQNFHPGWTAEIRPADGPPLRPDMSPRNGIVAVELPPGRGEVTLSYDAPLLGTGLLTSAVGTLLASWLWLKGRATV